jgi:hypothetical protein
VKQDMPAFLAQPMRAAVVAALREQTGATGRMEVLRQFLEQQLGHVALRYDFSRHGGNQRLTAGIY